MLRKKDLTFIPFKENSRTSNNQLRGGGCGQSKQKGKNINEITMPESEIPSDFLKNLNDNVDKIIKKASLILDQGQKVEVLMAIQWIFNNREHLNTCCISNKLTISIYNLVLNNFEKLLKILPIYLRTNWYLCYQALQICNELARIIYSFQLKNDKCGFITSMLNRDRNFEVEKQQEYLNDLEEFKTQLEIEKANVWKCGIEFELNLIKIMLINANTNSQEGKEILINIVKNIGQSIISMSATDNLIPSLINGAKFLLLKFKNKFLYPLEVYATYYLFQIIKWSIIKQLKSKYSVYKQIKQIKDTFQEYILLSDNWILHSCWIMMIADILAYRPIINKQLISTNPIEQYQKWNDLIEAGLIHCVSYNPNQAQIVLFKFDLEIVNLLEAQGKIKLELFQSCLLTGELAQNINIWDFYKNFSFQKNKQIQKKDYEILLVNNELNILERSYEYLKQSKDELCAIQLQIQELLSDEFLQSKQTELSNKLYQDELQVLIKQFINSYKKAIYQIRIIQEFMFFEQYKFNLLIPYFNFIKEEPKCQLIQILKQIQDTFKSQLENFQVSFFKEYINAIEYVSQISITSLNFKQIEQKNLHQNCQLFNIQNLHDLFKGFQKQFDQFIKNIRNFTNEFLKQISEMNQISNMIQFKRQEIFEFLISTRSISWIQKLIEITTNSFLQIFKEFKVVNKQQIESISDVKQKLIDCKRETMIAKTLKQILQAQLYRQQIFKEKLNLEQKPLKQQFGQLDQNFIQNLINLMKQEKEKIQNSIKNEETEEEAQNFDIKIKEILKMIKNDYIKIQKDDQCINNQTIEIYQCALNLISKAQFNLISILNQANQKQCLTKLIKKYDDFINSNEIEYRKKLDTGKTVLQQTDHNKSNNTFSNFFDFYQEKINSNLEIIQGAYIHLKSYKSMIQIGLDMILNLKEKNIDLNTQIAKLKVKCNKMLINFNEEDLITKLKVINGNNQGLEVQGQEEISFTLENFIALSDIQSSHENCKSQTVDEIYLTILKDLEQQQIEIKISMLGILDFKTPYKVKEFLAFNLIRLQQSVQEDCITQFSSKFLQYLWIFEKDQRVGNILKNKELIEMQKQLFSSNLQSSADQIKQEMKQRINNLENLQQEIRLEGNLTIREKLQKKIEIAYEELDQYVDNLSEMSQKMEMSLLFLKDIQKDVKQIKTQMENLQKSLNQIGDDIRKLRGKKYDELLEIRKQKILQQSKILEIDSIYVSVKTIEFDPISGEIKKTQKGQQISQLLDDVQNNFDGEVNEFIWREEKKDVMLLSGNAGSGKSRAARKIEEFVWSLHGKSSKWIPIYVSLPNLKNPKYNLFEQALESDNYGFDKHQIEEFKEAIQNKKEFILMILDSYDEMKQDCIQQNLILTNKFNQDLNIDKLQRQLKVIITTRKEIFTVIGYQTWFYGESLESLKEVQLQNFDQDQIQEYLRKYVELSVRRKIKQIYEFVKQVQNSTFELQEFQEIWQLIEKQVKCASEDSRDTDEVIFRKQELENLLQQVTSHKALKYLKEEHIISLRKDLQPLWSVKKFEKAIKNVGIQDLLTTPFMLEIVVQVLPNMTKQYKGSIEIRNLFIQNYIKIIKKQKLSEQLRLIDVQNQDFLNQKENNQSYSQLDNDQKLKQKDYEKNKQDNSEKDKQKLKEVIDQLDKRNFFSFYLITSVLISKNNSIYVDNIQFDFDINEVDNIIQALKMQKFTIFEFYESFIKFYHSQQIQKQREKGNFPINESFESDVYQFSQSLALDMTIRDLSQVKYKQKGKLELVSKYNSFKNVIDDIWPNQYFSDTLDNKDYNAVIRSCILVSAKGSTYSFNHKSIQEFYVAKYILDLLLFFDCEISFESLKRIEKENQILIGSLYNQIKLNISKESYMGISNFVKDKLQNIDGIKNTLINIVTLSRDEKYKYAASNSIYLLNQLNAQLESQDLSSIQLSDTNISGLSFYNSNLSNSKFEKVKINSCNFNCVNLTEVNWKEIICKEKPCLQGHQSEVQIALFSPKGNLIVSGDREYKLKLWDVDNHTQVAQLIGHNNYINSVQFTSDITRLISCSDDGTIKLWDLSNPQQPQLKVTIQNNISIKQIVLSKDDNMLISRSNNNFNLWNMPNLYLNQDTRTIQGENDATKIFTYSQDESLIAIGKNDATILIINLMTKKEQKLIGHIGNIEALALSPEGNILASACSNFNLLVWDLCSFKLIQVLLYNSFKINQLAFIQSDKSIIANSYNSLALIELEQLKPFEEISINQCSVVYLSQFDDICILGQDNYIAILDLNTLQIINSFQCEFTVESISISSDSLQLSTQGQNKLIIWSLQTLQQMVSLEDYKNFEYGVHYNNMETRIFKIQRIAQTYKLKSKLILNQIYIQDFKINLNNEILAYQIYHEEIILFNINYKEELDVLKLSKDSIKSFVFSPSVNILASAHDSKKIILWNLDNQPYSMLELVSSYSQYELKDFKYSYDGSLLIILDSTSSIYIWNSFDGNLKYKIDEKYRIEKEITISINNQYIALIDNKQNDKIIIWNLSLMKEENLLKEEARDVNLIKYIHNKMRLISFSQGAKVIFWNAIEGNVEYQINWASEYISQVCFSKNGNLMAWTEKEMICLWDCSKVEIEMIGCEKFQSEIRRLNFIGNSNNLIYLLETQISILPQQLLNSEKIIQLHQQQSKSQLSSFSQNYQLLAIIQSCNIHIFLVQGWKFYKTLVGVSEIQSIMFFYDENQLISSNSHGDLTIWNVHSGQVMVTFKTYKNAKKLYLINNDKILVLVGEQISFWNLENISNIKLCGLYSKQFDKYIDFKIKISHKKDQFSFNPTSSKFIIKQLKEQQDIRFYQHKDNIKKLEIFEQNQQCFICDENNNLIILSLHNEDIFMKLKEFPIKDILRFFQFEEIAITPNQKLLAIKSFSNIQIIQLQERKITWYQPSSCSSTQQFFFNKNGDMLIDVVDKQITLYLLNKKFELKIDWIRNFSNEVKLTKISQSNSFLSVLLNSGDLLIINLIERQQIAEISCNNIQQIAISLDDKYLFVIKENYLKKFDIKELSFSDNIKLSQEISCMAIISNNQICIADKDFIYLINLDQELQQSIKIDNPYESTHLAYHPKLNLLFSCGKDNKIYQWNIEAKRNIGIFEGHQGLINSLSFSSDGLILASSSDDKLIKLWNIEANSQLDLQQGHLKSVNQLAISKDSLILASGSQEFYIILWDLLDIQYIITLEGHNSNVNCLDFSYCSKWLVSGSEDGTIILWDVRNLIDTKVLHVVKEIFSSIRQVQFSPNGMTFATTSTSVEHNIPENKIQFWNLNNIGIQNIYIKPYREKVSLTCFTQNDEFIIQGLENNIQTYRLSTGQYDLLNGHKNKIILIDSSNDNTKIVSIDVQQNMFLWKYNNNKWQKQSISLFEPAIQKVIFSPQNTIIASQNENSITLTQVEELKQIENIVKYNLKTGTIKRLIQSQDGSKLLIQINNLSNDGQYLAAKKDLGSQYLAAQTNLGSAIDIYSISDLKCSLQQFHLLPNPVSFQFKQNDSNLLYVTQNTKNEVIIKILNISQNTQEEIFFQHESSIWDMFYISSNLNYLVAITKDSNLHFISTNYKKQNNSETSLLMNETIQCHAFSQDDKFFMVSTNYNWIYLWNIFDQKKCDEFECFTGKEILYLAFSLDNQIICCEQTLIFLIKIQQDQKLKIIRQFQLPYKINHFSFSPENLQICLINNDSAELLVANLIERQQKILVESNINDFCFTFDFQYIAVVTKSSLCFFDANNQKELSRDKNWFGSTILFLGNNQLILGFENLFYVLEISNLNQIKEINCIEHLTYITSISISKDLTYLALKNHISSTIKLWNIKDVKKIYLEKIYKNNCFENQKVLISQDNKFLIFNYNQNLQLINIQEDCKQLFAIDFKYQEVHGFQYSSDGKYFAIIIQGQLKLYNSETYQQIELIFEEKKTKELVFSLKKNFLALNCTTKVVCLQFENEMILKTKQLQNFNNEICAIAISPFGDKLISGEPDSSIRLWDIDKEYCLSWISNQNDEPLVFAFFPYGKAFVGGIKDGSVNLYRIDSKNKIQKQNQKQRQNQSQIEKLEGQNEELYFSCCKSFSRNSLIFAHNCKLSESNIDQSILRLFLQKGAIN
ncbi:unnamed protein product [Paramecium sonneborni]|uniref:NACHT domain-containing protein n=1 Tax=Paramecium sonneborni TaxID=65129 RepID=A0A8S1M4J3_9CILI|nr:unnamed protein product [Paramecium sonneborni]